jgi:ribonuclease P protein component
MKRYSLGKEERVQKASDFKQALHGGRKELTEHFKVFIYPNHLEIKRLGITTSRRVGSAVKRNRIKRLLREFFRLHKTCFPPSSDIVFIAKPGADKLDYSRLREELKNILCV